MKTGKATPELSLRMMLYSYSLIFHINPHEAQHTPLSTMIEMLGIHSEVETLKSEKLEEETKKQQGQRRL
mgnify:CR=1 FL=1